MLLAVQTAAELRAAWDVRAADLLPAIRREVFAPEELQMSEYVRSIADQVFAGKLNTAEHGELDTSKTAQSTKTADLTDTANSTKTADLATADSTTGPNNTTSQNAGSDPATGMVDRNSGDHREETILGDPSPSNTGEDSEMAGAKLCDAKKPAPATDKSSVKLSGPGPLSTTASPSSALSPQLVSDELLEQSLTWSDLSSLGKRSITTLALVVYQFVTKMRGTEPALILDWLPEACGLMSAADAKAHVCLLWRSRMLWRETLQSASDESKQRTLDRALCVASVNSLTIVLTPHHVLHAGQLRLFAYFALPASFEGLWSKARVMEAYPALDEFSGTVMSPDEEKAVAAEWHKCVEDCKGYDGNFVLPTFLNATNYILYLRISRFLQNPSDYLAACAQGCAPLRVELLMTDANAPLNVDDVEDGEAETEQTDILTSRFREIEVLASKFLSPAVRWASAVTRKAEEARNQSIQQSQQIAVKAEALKTRFAIENTCVLEKKRLQQQKQQQQEQKQREQKQPKLLEAQPAGGAESSSGAGAAASTTTRSETLAAEALENAQNLPTPSNPVMPVTSPLDDKLLVLMNSLHREPTAFIELFTRTPVVAVALASHILAALHIHFFWPQPDHATCFVHDWAQAVNSDECVCALQTAIDQLKGCTPKTWVNGLLGLELACLSRTVKPPPAADGAGNNAATGNPAAPPKSIPAPGNLPPPTSATSGYSLPTAGAERRGGGGVPTLPSTRSTVSVARAFTERNLQLYGNSSISDPTVIMQPLDFDRWRKDAHAGGGKPPTPTHPAADLTEELAELWENMCAREAADLDPEAEVSMDDRYFANELNAWRAMRAAIMSGHEPRLTQAGR